MHVAIERNKLFTASCLALPVTSLSFAISAGMPNRVGLNFHFDEQQPATIKATAFWGFPLAVVIGGIVADIIGMKWLLSLPTHWKQQPGPPHNLPPDKKLYAPSI